MSTPTSTGTSTPTSTPHDPGAGNEMEDPVVWRGYPSEGVCARGLAKTLGGKEVIAALDMTIDPGTIVGLIGPSGSGKTTTVRLLAGLLAPTSGWASVNGIRSTELSASDRARIGYLPQSPALFPDLSLSENLSFHASMYGLPLRRKSRLLEMLEWVELDDHRTKRVSEASGGMQKRLALAAAFVHDPDVIFLDEPTAGIDPILRDRFWQRFRVAADRGRTLLVTTQYVGEAGECDQVGLLSDGELLILDTPAGLRRAAFDGEVLDVEVGRPATDDELLRLRGAAGVIGVERDGAHLVRVVVDDAADAAGGLRPVFDEVGLDVVDVAQHHVDFDEAFVRIVERHRNGTVSETDADDPNRATGAPRSDVTPTEEDQHAGAPS